MIFAGIDIGSMTAKAAVIKENTIMGTLVLPTGYHPGNAATKIFEKLLKSIQLTQADISAVVATGYGRNNVSFANKAMTEIICHGTGAFFLNPDIRGVIDIGGQDSKAILLDDKGQVQDFAMNDKCAAGTGRFLEVMANALEVNLKDMGKMAQSADNPCKISSICTVFAESEVISMIAGQKKRKNIIAGIHESAAARAALLAAKIKLIAPVMMTGGVAKNAGMVTALEARLGYSLILSDLSQENGAIGAAVLASRL